MTESLRAVATLVRREIGMVFADSQLPAIAAAITRLDPELTPEAFLAQADDPRRAAALIARLVDEVTIKETYFLRHRAELEAIPWTTLLGAARAQGRDVVRAWSVACATGEEPYSLLMLAERTLGGSHVDMLATDVAQSALERVRAPRYGKRAMRHVEPALRDRFFTAQGDAWAVTDATRSAIRVARHNLTADPIPPRGESPFDLIVCRNVLIYFAREQVEQTVSALETALHPHGMLLLGAADRLAGGAASFRHGAGGSRPPAERPARRSTERRRRPRPAPPPTPPTRPGHDALLASALAAADAGRLDEALALTDALVSADPLAPEPHYVRGVALLALGEARRAVEELRRALYHDPRFAAAAFALGRSHEAAGDRIAAQRAFWQVVRLADEARPDCARLLEPGHLAPLASAARARLAALAR